MNAFTFKMLYVEPHSKSHTTTIVTTIMMIKKKHIFIIVCNRMTYTNYNMKYNKHFGIVLNIILSASLQNGQV